VVSEAEARSKASLDEPLLETTRLKSSPKKFLDIPLKLIPVFLIQFSPLVAVPGASLGPAN
jgi:hypothetical protein